MSSAKESIDAALESYEQASTIAVNAVRPTHPLRLGLALNFSVFYYEILHSPERACHLAKTAFDEAIAEVILFKEQQHATLIRGNHIILRQTLCPLSLCLISLIPFRRNRIRTRPSLCSSCETTSPYGQVIAQKHAQWIALSRGPPPPEYEKHDGCFFGLWKAAAAVISSRESPTPYAPALFGIFFHLTSCTATCSKSPFPYPRP